MVKELVTKIEAQLNNREQWEIENGVWLYKFEIKNDEIEVRVYDSEIKEIYLKYSFAVDIVEDAVTLLKSMIAYLYDNEINHRQAYLNGDKGYYNRKHKSLALWLDRNKQDRVDVIVQDIAKRYKESNQTEAEITYYKEFVGQFYSCLKVLEPYWKVAEIKDSICEKIKKLNINNVEISCIEDRIVIVKSDGKNIIDKFEMVIGSYTNKSEIVNQAIGRLNIENVA